MTKLNLSILLGVTTAVAVAGGTSYGIIASNNNKKAAPANNVEAIETAVPTKNGANASDKLDASKVYKDETVYVITNPDGSTKKTIVSNELSNITSKGTLEDVSNLTSILNLKGDETFTQDGSKLLWNTDSKDIYYQGTTDKKLPVETRVSFTLDGQAIAASDLHGKSGKVEMKYVFANNQQVTVKVGENEVTKYVPFLVLGGTMLKTDQFQNISIDNGKIISKGNKAIVVGYALPKLQDNLNLTSDIVTIPDSFTITADVTNFSLDTFITYADSSFVNKIVAETSAKDFIDDSMENTLIKAHSIISSLKDGSSSFYEAFTALTDKESDLRTGLDTLSTGVNDLFGGIEQVDGGLSQLLYTQIKDEETGEVTSTIDNNAAMKDGAEKTFNALLAQVTTSVREAGINLENDLTIDNYSATLTAIMNSFNDSATAQAFAASVQKQVTREYRKNITLQVAAAMGKEFSTYDDYDEGIDDESRKTISATVKSKMETEEIQTQIANVTSQKLTEAQKSLKEAKASLDDYNTFYTGLVKYCGGVAQLKQGVTKILSYKDQMVDGVKELSTELLDICDKFDGVKAELSQEDMQNIQKLIDSYNLAAADKNDVEATIRAAEAYKSYSGINDEMNGAVRFIFRSDAI